MRGTQIAFYVYHHFGTVLDDYNIKHYNNYIPLNYKIPSQQYAHYSTDVATGQPPNPQHINYIMRCGQAYRNYENSITFNTDSIILKELEVKNFKEIDHPHIFDLLNEKHHGDIHKLFKYVAEQNPNDLFLEP